MDRNKKKDWWIQSDLPGIFKKNDSGLHRSKIFNILWLYLFLCLGSSDLFRAESSPLPPETSPDHLKDFEESLILGQHTSMAGHRVRLYNLNPHINQWYLLEIRGRKLWRIHLDSRYPQQVLRLTSHGLKIFSEKDSGDGQYCNLWQASPEELLNIPFQSYQNPFYPVCDGLVFIRLQRSSNTELSLTEWSTEVLRRTDFGENIINSIKPLIVKNGAESAKSYPVEKVRDQSVSSVLRPESGMSKDSAWPEPASAFSPQSGEIQAVTGHQLGVSLRNSPESLLLGQWYESEMHRDIFISMFTPSLIKEEIIKSADPLTWPAQEDEKDKLVYLVAYNLGKYQVRYAVGTMQPPVIHSKESYGKTSVLRRSLVSVGSIPPYHIARTAGVFIGGFKERHSVFTSGPHKGKTYGYIESGVELSPMNGGLATISVDLDGKVTIGQWPEDANSQKILRTGTVSARQNGVLLVDNKIPGQFVKDWKSGNWSADAHGVRTSLRAGVCIQESERERFLIFFAFTSATPSTMAKVMMAYDCITGMHLDMNAYMYLHNALFSIDKDGALKAEYLNKEMLYPPGLTRHRFILDNNRRDFFYVMRRDSEQPERWARYKPLEALNQIIPDYFKSYFQDLK